jgi:hypothetical protein
MSLAIDVDRVNSVLLADGWHEVAETSFDLDSYEYLSYEGGPHEDPMVLHGGGHSGVCATGFAFKESATGRFIAGPLTAIHAVMYSSRT